MNRYPPSRLKGLKKRWPQRTDKERFLSHILKTNFCWIWQGAIKNSKGYGNFYFSKKVTSAHRASWFIFNGKFDPSLHVLHHCDNPGCVNPEHLFLGTNQDNINDAIKKGRGKLKGLIGANNKKAKLSNEQVLDIRNSTRNSTEIAVEYNIHPKTVSRIRRRKCWTHI